jgi:hypothetical protein
MNALRVALPNNPANANGGLSETITGTLTKPELLITQSSYRLSKKREGDTITLLDDRKRSVIDSPQVQTYYNYLLEQRNDYNKVILWSQKNELAQAM